MSAAATLERLARGVARAPLRPLSGRIVALQGPVLRVVMERPE